MQHLDKCETRGRPTLLAINDDLRQAIVFRPRCKQWSCPYCAQINRRLWVVRTYYGAEVLTDRQNELRFVTLTSHERLSYRATWQVWPKAWSILYNRAKRKQPDASYILVPEQHKDGRLHIHMLTNWTMPTRWWKDNARECGLGYIAEAEEPKSLAHAAWYIGKYISKQLDVTTWPKGFRRVRPAHNWPKTPPPGRPDGWRFEPAAPDKPLSHYVSYYGRGQGYGVWWADDKQAWRLIEELQP